MIPTKKENEVDPYSEFDQIKEIGPAIKKKLIECNFTSLKLIATSRPKEIANKTGISENKAEKIVKDVALKLGYTFKPANELFQERKEIGRISTSSNKLDLLLGGGVETQAITEVYGGFRSGKTQLAHQLAINVQLPKEKGGLDSNAIYIDTENTFRPERIVEMASYMELDEQKVLNNIQVATCYNSDHQILIVNQLKHQLKTTPAKIIILDSLMTFFRADYIGKDQLMERQSKLLAHLNELKNVAKIYDAAVLVTNHISATLDPIGEQTKPTGGNVVAHFIQNRLSLKASRGNQRIARLIDSPYLPEGQVTFQITSHGVRDI
ncbi:MAG: DNA repair and recombination protein RadA [Candidatus Lokiarchaeota archaeon]|nr:DNA repair and recombination protein RadA [Candidatus Lokiarchaeota archaeon]